MRRFVCASVVGILGAMAAEPVRAAEPTGPAEPKPAVTASASAPELPSRVNSINGNPLGFLIGAYALNYERLFDAHHGVLIEGEYLRFGGGDNYVTSYGGSAGYRWHWSGGQDSGFLGANVGYHHGGAGASVDGEDHSLSVDTIYAVINVGRRFAWRSGFNITLRIGSGRAWHLVSAESDEPGAEEAEDTIQDLLNFIPVAFDAELSIGYSF